MRISNARATICLNMIVKDEAHVIARCLTSARPLIDRWCIVDTGSSDDTIATIRSVLADVPGEVHQRPWRNFAHNRNEALDLARTQGSDYVLFIDADETFVVPPDFEWPALDADAYEFSIQYDQIRYARVALVASRVPWRWHGALHEYLDCGQPHSAGALTAPTILVRHDGARSRDATTYLKDIAILEEELRKKPDSTRDMFYLAQSYRDAGRLSESKRTYQRRAAMGGWDEEVWYSLFQVAVLSERLNEPPSQVSANYLAAFNTRPSRAEPLVELARYHRLKGEHGLAFLYARHASEMSLPSDRLFVDEATYRWRALDELGVSAYYVGTQSAKAAGAEAVRRLLDERLAPPGDLARIEANRHFYPR